MTGNEPMSEQTLTMIRELLAYDGRQWGDYSQQELFRACWSAQLLLAEVERLRAEDATMRPMMEKVAAAEPYYSEQPEGWHCTLCDGWYPEQWSPYPDGGKSQFQHDVDCPVTQARAYLAAHPTAGENEEA